MSEIPDELSLDGSWALSESIFAAMLEELEILEPRVLVEFGSGRSTVRLAQALPGVEIHSIEHDAAYLQKTEDYIKAYAGDANIRVELRPLTWQAWHRLPYFSYEPGSYPASIDAVLVDGPPSVITPRGREACLHHVYSALRIGGRVFLDDCERPAEQRVISNWMETYPNSFSLRFISGEKDMCVLTKERDVTPVFRKRVLADLMVVAAHTKKEETWRQLGFK